MHYIQSYMQFRTFVTASVLRYNAGRAAKEVAYMEYVKCGDYYIPNLILEPETRPFGRWGRLQDQIRDVVIPTFDIFHIGNLLCCSACIIAKNGGCYECAELHIELHIVHKNCIFCKIRLHN